MVSNTTTATNIRSRRRSGSLAVLIPAFLQPHHSPKSENHNIPSPTLLSFHALRPPTLFVKDPSPPPDDLLGDNPFENLSSAGSPSAVPSRSPSRSPPTSPLHSPPILVHSAPPRISKRVRPAYTRPAFRPQPSLPSLRELSNNQSFGAHFAHRRGTLGARFPLEPWAHDYSHDDAVTFPCRTSAPVRVADDVPGLQPASIPMPITMPAMVIETHDGIDRGMRSLDRDDTNGGSDRESAQLDHVLESPEEEEVEEEEEDREDTSSDEDSFEDISVSFGPWVNSIYSNSGSAKSSSAGDERPLSFSAGLAYDEPDPELRSSPPLVPRQAPSTATLASLDSLQLGPLIFAHHTTHPSLVLPPLDRPSHTKLRRVASCPTLCAPSSSSSRGAVTPDRPMSAYGVHASADAHYYASASSSSSAYPASHATSGMASQSRSTSAGQPSGSYARRPSAGAGGNGNGPVDVRRQVPAPRATNNSSSESDSESSEDDDVPLAAAIPGALKAQRTIRKQYREERAAKKERTGDVAAPPSSFNAPPSPPSHDTATSDLMRSRTVLKPGEAPRLRPRVARALQAAQAQAQAQANPPPTAPLPPNPTSPTSKFNNVVRQMQGTQLADPGYAPAGAPTRRARANTLGGGAQRPQLPSGAAPDMQYTQSQQPEWVMVDNPSLVPQMNGHGAERILRPMRSFHNPSSPPSAAAGGGGATGVGRSATSVRRRQIVPEMPTALAGGADLGRARSARRPPQNPAAEGQGPPSGELERRPSGERGRTVTAPASSSAPPPVPALPSSPPQTPHHQHHALAHAHVQPAVKLTQHRIFVGDAQTFHTLELSPSATAATVLTILDEQGALDKWKGTGGWMLFEVAQDFGMERPIRTFERVEDVMVSWNRDKTGNSIVARLTPLANVLARSQIPDSSPTHGGWVEYEAKRGKWSKRWLSLREHALWIGKREGGRGGELLCQLSTFDAYALTRAHKAPKSSVFAVKSTESLAFFEDASDFLHMFAADDRNAEIWMQKILLARSYLIQQERNVLASKANANAQVAAGSGAQSSPVPGTGGGGLSRAGTTRRPAPSQPLVSVPPPYVPPNVPTGPPATYGFQPGSLLGRR